jgi:hypothetical protein
MRRVLSGDWGPRASSFSEDDVYLRDADLDIIIEYSSHPLNTASLKRLMPSKSKGQHWRSADVRFFVGPLNPNKVILAYRVWSAWEEVWRWTIQVPFGSSADTSLSLGDIRHSPEKTFVGGIWNAAFVPDFVA